MYIAVHKLVHSSKKRRRKNTQKISKGRTPEGKDIRIIYSKLIQYAFAQTIQKVLVRRGLFYCDSALRLSASFNTFRYERESRQKKERHFPGL